MYPDLVGKHFTATVESALPFDKPDASLDWLELSVGEGLKGHVLGFHGGCTGDPISLELPTPPDLPPSTRTEAPRKPDKNCELGWVLSKQILISVFRFDREGRLIAFGLVGPSIPHLDAHNSFAELVLSHPQMTYEEIVQELKKAGTKYGPEDKEAFVRNFPLKKLEAFWGELEILSVSFSPLQEDRYNIATWPDWVVRAKAKSSHEDKAIYEFNFDQFDGELVYFKRVVHPE